MLDIDVPEQVRVAPELGADGSNLELGHVAHQVDAHLGCRAEQHKCGRSHQRIIHTGIAGTPRNKPFRIPCQIHIVQKTDVPGAVRVQVGHNQVVPLLAVFTFLLETHLREVQRTAAVFSDDIMVVNPAILVVGKDVDAVHKAVFNIGRIGLGGRLVIAHDTEIKDSHFLAGAFGCEGGRNRLRVASCQCCQQHSRPYCHSERSEESLYSQSHRPNRFQFLGNPCTPYRCCSLPVHPSR